MSNAERQFAGCSSDVYHRNLEEDETPFCNQENWQGSVVFLNQEVELMGLQSICDKTNGNNQLDVIALVNIAWELIQSQKDKRKKISEQETQIRKLHSDVEQLHINAQRLRDLIEYKERQAHAAENNEKQTMVANTQIQSDLKKAKDEIKKLSSTVLLRESRFIHEAKRRDQEIGKLKERLLKVMSEAKQQGVAQYGSMSIEIIGDLANKPDGKSRGRWQNDLEDQKRGDDLLQRAFDAYEERQEALANEVTKLQTTISTLTENGPQNGEGCNSMNVGAVAAAHNEWTEDALSEHFSLGTFVPLSEVKHTAPPGWVSRAHCTLPPRPITGKAETIKLRSSGGGLSERPRPRSSHLSPYRGMQVTPPQNQVMYKTAKTSSRSGSMSPTSASPTRLSKGDTRSLPRMTGAKLSLVRRPPSQTSSANNSSADESVASSAYQKIIGRRSIPRLGPGSRPLSPMTLSPADSENESSSNGNELSQQLRKLGKYLEKKQTARTDSDNPIDPQIDEHLVNIRKALKKNPK